MLNSFAKNRLILKLGSTQRKIWYVCGHYILTFLYGYLVNEI